ncbi:MAG: Ig-like domain-containing protein, partial [Acidobacteriota bacterium]
EGVVADLDTPQSPVHLVDPNLGFDLATMMQGDQIHPNVFGEQYIADAFRIALESILPAGNPAPSVALTAPADGAVAIAPATFELAASASDVNGSVVEVRFFADGALLGADALEPYGLTWTPAPGSYLLTAVAEDDGGATRTSAPVAVTVLPTGSAVPVAVVNPSFELPTLGDGAVRNNSGIDGWTFTGTSATFRGVFNPPSGSYPEAAGQGTPVGADGAQVAFLFNNGGPAESTDARQDLAETLVLGRDYTLRVAIGAFDPNQPFPPASFGGYRIELLAGNTVIAVDQDTQVPPLTEFRDAVAVATAAQIDPSLAGQPLAIRLRLGSDAAQRSTHFDDVRLEWTPAAPNQAPFVSLTAPADGSTVDAGAPVALEAAAADADGAIVEVRFFVDGVLVAVDDSAPYSAAWTPSPAASPVAYLLRAEAEDDAGAVASSPAATVTALPPVAGGSLTVVNPSFEQPALGDGSVQDNTGVPGWTFSGTAGTYRGVFNPPAGSYPEAAGQGTPIGADGAQVAFLFNNLGAGESVEVRQDLGDALVAGRDYTLRVAVGAFDPSQPFPPSSFGGYRLELLAGSTVIASAVGTDAPPMATFTEVTATSLGAEVDPALVGQPLAVRITRPSAPRCSAPSRRAP